MRRWLKQTSFRHLTKVCNLYLDKRWNKLQLVKGWVSIISRYYPRLIQVATFLKSQVTL